MKRCYAALAGLTLVACSAAAPPAPIDTNNAVLAPTPPPADTADPVLDSGPPPTADSGNVPDAGTVDSAVPDTGTREDPDSAVPIDAADTGSPEPSDAVAACVPDYDGNSQDNPTAANKCSSDADCCGNSACVFQAYPNDPNSGACMQRCTHSFQCPYSNCNARGYVPPGGSFTSADVCNGNAGGIP